MQDIEWTFTEVFILEREAPKGSLLKRETERVEHWLKRSMVKGGWNCAHTKQAMIWPGMVNHAKQYCLGSKYKQTNLNTLKFKMYFHSHTKEFHFERYKVIL